MSPSYLLFGDTGLWFQGPFWTSNWFPYRGGEADRVIGAQFGVQKNKKKISQSNLGSTWEWVTLNRWLVLFSISNWKFRWDNLILEQDYKPKTCCFLLLCQWRQSNHSLLFKWPFTPNEVYSRGPHPTTDPEQTPHLAPSAMSSLEQAVEVFLQDNFI